MTAQLFPAGSSSKELPTFSVVLTFYYNIMHYLMLPVRKAEEITVSYIFYSYQFTTHQPCTNHQFTTNQPYINHQFTPMHYELGRIGPLHHGRFSGPLRPVQSLMRLQSRSQKHQQPKPSNVAFSSSFHCGLAMISDKYFNTVHISMSMYLL